MERYTIQRLALRPDQASRLFEFGFKIKSLYGRTVQYDLEYNSTPMFDVGLPRSAVIVREPAIDLGGPSGVARIQPTDTEGYIREFRWRPAVGDVPARMTGFVRTEEYVRKLEKKREKRDEDDAGTDSLHA